MDVWPISGGLSLWMHHWRGVVSMNKLSIHEGFSVIGCVAEDVRGTRFTMKMFVPRDFDPIKNLNFCEAVSPELVDETA